MRFVFLQSELKSKTNSHFYQYLQAIEEVLVEQGHACLTVANELFEKEQSDQNTTISFRNHTSRYSNPFAVLWRIMSRNISTCIEFKQIMEFISKQHPKTVFFIDTIQNERIIALAWAFRKLARKNVSVSMAVVFRFTYQSNSFVLTWLQKKLHSAFCYLLHDLIVEKRCLLFTDSKLLQEAYAKNISEPVTVLPIPLRSDIYQQIQSQKKNSTSVRTIGFIGGKIAYKGLDLFLIQLVLLAKLDVRFLIHGVRDTEELIQFAQLVLSSKQLHILQQNIDKIEVCSQLNEREYFNLFQRMDLILIPYTSLQFAQGTSNIFAESVAAGVIPFVPLETWMGDELIRAGFQQLVVNFSDDQSAYCCIADVIEDSVVLKQKINDFSSTWRSYHSSVNFVNRFIQALQV